jgi:homoserine O-acetyltransferase
MEKKLIYKDRFELELGGVLNGIEICYHTYGKFDSNINNVVWVCHALTANSDAQDWWSGIVGDGKLYDPAKYFIVCANYLGSCYGTTGPLSINPETGKPYYREFPKVTVRDMIKAHNILREHLGIKQIHTVLGGSIGGFQALEWSIINPDRFTNMILIGTNEKTTPWLIAFNESQRMAISADKSYFEDTPEGGKDGLKAARSIALLSYRNYDIYNNTQQDASGEITDNFNACSYQQYQGTKLVNRFNAYSYINLTHSVDTHNVTRGRGSVNEVLSQIEAKTLCIGTSSDILFPSAEQKRLAELIPNAEFIEINSRYGHDGFLIESEKITEIINDFYK